MNFGEKVKQLRAERNLTQPQLAQSIGIEQSYLSKLENDKSVPSAEIFQSILRAFSIDVGTLLAGVDETIVHRDLRQIPEVSNHVTAKRQLRVHNIKAWLFASGIACALGLTLVVAGYRGLLFSKTLITYRSEGVILPGEPTNIFDIHRRLLNEQLDANLITREQEAALTEKFSRRFDRDTIVLDSYRGDDFIQDVAGGKRSYSLTREMPADRPENRWIMLAGVLLTFAGLLGFVVEQRLRSVRV